MSRGLGDVYKRQGKGRGFPVSKVIALDASDPEILIIATPDIPGPDESA